MNRRKGDNGVGKEKPINGSGARTAAEGGKWINLVAPALRGLLADQPPGAALKIIR
jgi:hypothetical protein